VSRTAVWKKTPLGAWRGHPPSAPSFLQGHQESQGAVLEACGCRSGAVALLYSTAVLASAAIDCPSLGY
jgi:hypothetical protein